MTDKQRARVLLLVSLFISLLLAELFLARFHPQATETKLLSDNPAMNKASNIIDVEILPNFRGHLRRKEFDMAIELNSLAHRQAEFDLDKGDRFRILAIGDSFTFGWGVEAREAYPLVLERWLDAASPESVEVINAGFTAGF